MSTSSAPARESIPLGMRENATLRAVPKRQKILSPTEVDRVRKAMRKLSDEMGSDTKAAAFVGVGQSTYSRYLSTQRPGIGFSEDLALKLNKDPNFFRDFHADGGSVERVERLERYSNFLIAAETERRAGVSEEAIEAARADLKSNEDQSVDEWRRDIRAQWNRLRREATVIPTGRSIDEKNAARDAERTRAAIAGWEEESAPVKKPGKK
jgi:predicted transcriptional regulator